MNLKIYVSIHLLDISVSFFFLLGYAWALVSAPERIVTDQKWQCETPNLKTRTDVLLDSSFNLLSFGEKALQDYFSLDEKDSHYFFEKFKMSLFGEQMTQRPTIRATNGKQVPAMSVFSQALRFMMQHVMERLRTGIAVQVLPSDILWVLTVPAIWSNGAKQLMREGTDRRTDVHIFFFSPPSFSVLFVSCSFFFFLSFCSC